MLKTERVLFFLLWVKIGHSSKHYNSKHKMTRRELLSIVDCSKDPKALLRHLQRYLETVSNKKRVAVFDIDDTLLSSRDDESICVHPVGRFLFDTCLRLNIRVVLVTARQGSPTSLKYCRQQLAALHYNGFDRLYMQSKEDTDTAQYKARVRREVARELGDVILNCGDQLSDLTCQREDDTNYIRSNLSKHTYYVLRLPHDPAKLSVKFEEMS